MLARERLGEEELRDESGITGSRRIGVASWDGG